MGNKKGRIEIKIAWKGKAKYSHWSWTYQDSSFEMIKQSHVWSIVLSDCIDP